MFPANAFVCPKANVVQALKKELLDILPFSYPARNLSFNSGVLTKFILDPLSLHNGFYQLTRKPKNYDQILALTRLIAFFYHLNRAIAVQKIKRKNQMFGKVQWRKKKDKRGSKSKPTASFIEIFVCRVYVFYSSLEGSTLID